MCIGFEIEGFKTGFPFVRFFGKCKHENVRTFELDHFQNELGNFQVELGSFQNELEKFVK